MKKILSLAVLAAVLSACSTTGRSLEQTGLLYPHSNSPYLMGAPAKAYKPSEEQVSTTKPSSVNPNAINQKLLSEQTTNKSTETANNPKPQTYTYAKMPKKREIAIINAPYRRTFQEVVKFCSLNGYHILKESYKEGFIRCDITTNTAQYYQNTTPKMVSKFVLNAPSLGGLAAWTLNMDMFITPGNGKTMIEFIPKYYAVSMNSKGKLVLVSNGYFENSTIAFIEHDLKEFP